MAKLSAHGRTQVARFVRKNDNGCESVWAIMSDRVILRKTVYLMRVNPFSETDTRVRRRSSSWRRIGKLKEGQKHFDHFVDGLESTGFVKVK